MFVLLKVSTGQPLACSKNIASLFGYNQFAKVDEYVPHRGGFLGKNFQILPIMEMK